MSRFSEAWLEELNLSPLWRRRGAVVAGATDDVAEFGNVAPASLPATTESKKYIQGIHNRGYLSHLKAEGGIYFVTFRLADSLPREVLENLEQIPPEARSKQIEAALDAGFGECWLRQSEIAELVSYSIRAYDGERYKLHDWVVMPNHVHLVIEPQGEHSLSDILFSIKSYTAQEANRLLERQGEFWQHESYDRLLRNEDELARAVNYVQQNPVKACLAPTPEQYRYGQAGFVAGKDAGATVPDAASTDGEEPVTPAARAEIDIHNSATLPDSDISEGKEIVAPASLPATTESIEVTTCDWLQLKQLVATCTKCKLHEKRTQAVFGVGDEQADILFVGEGPGEEEDLQGEPFVGQAGKLLDNMLASIDLRRGQKVYIANVVKCRPPGNRNPESEEASACAPYLDQQIKLIKPKLIVALGKVAAIRLHGQEASISSLRGKLLDYQGIPMLVTYHPAYLLRSLPDKAKAWQDLCLIRRTLRGLISS